MDQVTIVDSTRVKGGYYKIDYAFEVDGRAYTTYDQDVQGHDWSRMRDNSSFAVVYLPSNPKINRLVVPGEEDKPLDKLGEDLCCYSFVLLLGLVLSVGVVAAWMGLADASKRRT